ncbi:hypothetical protein BH10PSE12_BH10PSE12_33830 [soil metagenome]
MVGTYTDLRDLLVNLNYSGNPAKFAPRDSFTMGAAYTGHLGNGATLTPQSDLNFSKRISTDNYQIVNADDITAFLAVLGNGTKYWKISPIRRAPTASPCLFATDD